MTKIEQLYQYYLQHPRICTDSRKLAKGDIFVALRGERFDGHTFAKQALKDGAALCVVADESLAASDARMFLVEDTLKALQDLARHHRRQLSVPVIAVTGSNGKTTTKELLTAVLGSRYPVLATPGNFNNHIGLPLTLLMARDTHEVLVLEMGANHQGEIAQLCEIAEPTHGLITNIGKAHLEGFGGIEGVKKGKSELYRYLEKTGGLAFVNRDEQFLEDLSEGIAKRVFYGSNPSEGKFAGRLKKEIPFLVVAFSGQEIHSNLSGTYNLPNILTAATVGQYFKVRPASIKAAIESYVPANNRSEWKKMEGYTVLLDAYNANPTSMEHALRAFARQTQKPRWVILGDMLEMGVYSSEEHKRIFQLATDLGFEKVITAGPEFQSVHSNSRQAFEDAASLKEWWAAQDKSGATILLKGSRGIGLEKLIRE
ncbi:MAG: UDP-N-acetylmuramoyl-tripeptide--D-alanyl-D-alanine ligase [Bacteroidetes bacterium]|nr:UDP-N-acetylmuramoyl-tripeptide--D-alanyl-D-alanine ligase [Bacteroidota bacterium]